MHSLIFEPMFFGIWRLIVFVQADKQSNPVGSFKREVAERMDDRILRGGLSVLRLSSRRRRVCGCCVHVCVHVCVFVDVFSFVCGRAL